ncbi:MAG: STELLO glycosyltransferase family protein [Planctomycetota bacterium]|nr:STELLO glycosyltransferase family protein [Planctomycetota bacterium]
MITTINSPTAAVQAISDRCRDGWSAVAVGDTKTPPDWHCKGIVYLSVDRQKELFPQFADLVPYRHYCRKNLGYLYAIQQGAEVIFDTDDDNIPYEGLPLAVAKEVSGRLLSGPGWVNVYKHFTDNGLVWPRGLPLDKIHCPGIIGPLQQAVNCPVQQYLADRDPDVDAIFRLLEKKEVFFDRAALPVVLNSDAWVPFNSQATLFFKEAFPLLYLPCHVSFRMTDIWRSYVAQTALSCQGLSVAFRPPAVEQLRNSHNLMRDFEDEVVGYLHNDAIMQVLKRTAIGIAGSNPLPDVARTLWGALLEAGILESREWPIMEQWFRELNRSKE